MTSPSNNDSQFATCRLPHMPLGLKSQVVLVFAAFTIAFSSSLVTPLLPAILSHFALAPESQAQHIASLTGAFLLAMFIAAPALGSLSDRIDRRAVLLFAMGLYALSLYALGVASNLGALYVIRVIAGIGAGAVLPVIQAWIADHSDREQRVYRFAWIVTATLSGSLAGPYLGGLATGLETWSSRSAALPLHQVTAQVLAVAILCSVSLISTLLVLRQSPPTHPQVCDGSAVKTVILSRQLYMLFFLSMVVMFAVGAFDAGLSTFARATLHLGARQLAMLYAECALVMLVIQALYFAKWFKAFAHRHMMFPAMLVTAAALAAFPLVETNGQLIGLVGLLAAGAGATTPLISYRVSILADARQGTSFGLQSASSYLGQGLGAISSGVLFEFGSKMPYWLAAMILVAVALGIILRMRPFPR